jgi:hypothetical protein
MRPVCDVRDCTRPADWYLPAIPRRQAFYFCTEHCAFPEEQGYLRLIDADEEQEDPGG